MLILEMMAHRGKTLSQLVADLHERFGQHAYHRVDVHTSQSAKEKALAILKSSGGLTEIAGESVLEVQSLDGYKHRLDTGWLLIRPSGTEPVLRIYSESETAEQAKSNVDDAVDQLGV
jgi:phosphomannomutase